MRTRITRLLFASLFVLLVLTFGSAALPSPAAADAPIYHVVGWGDTLSTIATRYGTTMNAIMQANSLRDPNFIWTGERLLIPGASPARVPSKAGTYVVQAGDTLFSIASRNDSSVAELMEANKLYNYWIYAGQTLRIPGQVAPSIVPPPPAKGNYYVVRPGDYLSVIAARYQTTPYAIQIANRMPNSSFVYSGQRLYIPGPVTIINNGVVIINPQQPAPPPVAPPPAPVYPVYPVGPTVLPYIPPAVPSGPTTSNGAWRAVLLDNTSTPPCYLSVNVIGKANWPVVVATTDGSFISDPKYTGTKPEKGPYVVEFAHSCTGTWRVIPLGLNTYADVTLNGGHADLEFRQ